MQALDRVADIETTYGGRYVQSIAGIDGSISSRHDWFYFVNGIEGDRSAAEVRLRSGDIEWWDYRSWAKQMRQPVVVGAFPEPFRHGTTVVTGAPGSRVRSELSRRLGGLLVAATSFTRPGTRVPRRVNGDGVSATLGVETARRLLRDPSPSVSGTRFREARAGSALFAAMGAAALLAEHWVSVAVIAAVLLAVCLAAPAGRRRFLYLTGAAITALSVFLLTPFVETIGSHPLWTGPTIPVVGTLDIRGRSSRRGRRGAPAAGRLARLRRLRAAARPRPAPRSVRAGRRSTLAVVLATRLVPTLERDAAGLIEALRGRGVAVAGARGHARLVSPLVAGSLERAYNLAESLEARGYGRPGRDARAPAVVGRGGVARSCRGQSC